MNARLRMLFSALLVVFILAAAGFQTVSAQSGGVPAVVSVSVANVRSGPGTNYPVIGTARNGTRLTLEGRNAADSWYQACCVNNQRAWIARSVIQPQGNTAALPIVAAQPPPQPAPQPVAGWRGEYFANRNLQGAPTYTRVDPAINFRWGAGNPAPGIPTTNYSVRWTQTVNFQAGDYQFYAQVDDGVRLWVDNILVIDQWREGSQTTYSNVLRGIGAGPHQVRVEYFQALGDATAVVWWERAGQFPQWRGEYYNDIYLSGPTLLLRNDPRVNFNWGLGSPAPEVPADNFSIRWTRSFFFEGGNYAFNARTSDGVRIFLDGKKVLDEWHDADDFKVYTAIVYDVGRGNHTLTVEYYERGGIAYAMVWWNVLGGAEIPQ